VSGISRPLQPLPIGLKDKKPKLTDDQTTTRPLSQRPSKDLPLRKQPNSTARGKTNKENL
ncbi:hypothetical protein, partial [Pseudomonas aeruginosa]|uniref:hypothetical protein n=1 Tax=Pseudomonas aeruginosa TaxID=287 RepID=UPI001ABCD261